MDRKSEPIHLEVLIPLAQSAAAAQVLAAVASTASMALSDFGRLNPNAVGGLEFLNSESYLDVGDGCTLTGRISMPADLHDDYIEVLGSRLMPLVGGPGRLVLTQGAAFAGDALGQRVVYLGRNRMEIDCAYVLHATSKFEDMLAMLLGRYPGLMSTWNLSKLLMIASLEPATNDWHGSASIPAQASAATLLAALGPQGPAANDGDHVHFLRMIAHSAANGGVAQLVREPDCGHIGF